MTILLSDQIREKLRIRDAVLLDELFRELNPYLQRCLSSRGVFAEGAEDIICETWVSFLAKIDSFEGRSSIKTYLTGILFHKIQEHFRAQGRYVQTEEDIGTLMDEQFTAEGWWKQDPADPSTLFQSKEVGGMIEKCLEGLSLQQRNAFIMKEVEEEETETICGALGVSITNLGVLIYRAKEKLRKCLEGSLPGTLSPSK
jgi:RNA polymerase sigma-70 factor, ECF subfamily